MAYLSVEQVKRYLRNEQGATDDDIITEMLDAASGAIDDYCHRTFTAAAAVASARSFVPSGDQVLNIYDCTTITSITENGTTVATASWQAEPVNSLDGAGRTVPYSRVRRIDGTGWHQLSAYPGKASISVTATWGWASTPAAVKSACRIITSELIDERNKRGGLVVFDDFAAVAVQSRTVARLLGPLRTASAFGMA